MLKANRRTFLAAGAALPGAAAARGGKSSIDLESRVADDLQAYIGFGVKQAGGAGDIACGEWLASQLEALGFTVQRQSFQTPYFTAQTSEVSSGSVSANVWPQPIVIDTGPEGVSGRIVHVDAAGQADGALDGAIALIDLPYGRWSSATAKPIRDPIIAAFAGGAKGAVVVTNGPTGKIIALNADGRKPMFAGPVGLIAPVDAQPFRAAARRGEAARLIITGESGRRPAFNFIGRIDRGRKHWLVVSTPRSGWFTCAGERGPGIAAWLWIARWASRAVTDCNIAFVCNSGHEYENLGAAEALKAIAPKPAETRFWLHLGANAAARDWHELLGQWRALPGVDTQRCLSVSPALLPIAGEVFAGHAGLEAPYSSDELSAGEQIEILAAGYAPVAAVFGIHRYHHVADDDARCVSVASVARTAAAFQQLVERVLKS